jgi:hypothetical protein
MLSIVMAALLLPPMARAQDKPKAEDILDNYVKVTGGKAAFDKIQSVVAKGTFELAGVGIKGALTIYQAAPNKMYTEIDLGAMVGKIEQGTDGKVFWENSAIQGARLLEGDEKAAAKLEASINSEANWRDHYKSAELTGEENVDGKPAYKVVLTPKEGPPSTRFYDKTSGLLVKVAQTLNTPMGQVNTEAVISDYKKIGEITYPHKMQQKVGPQQVVITFDKVELNAKIPSERFALPEAVKKLVK